MQTTDTIYALSSGTPPTGVALIRISGPQALEAVAALTANPPAARQAGLRTIRNRNGNVLDQALVLLFPEPHSFTGEDCAEIHVHGSRAVVAAVYAELADMGLRLAEAGEFSRRAFENGKLDLVEIEGLADLISAETEMQRRLAIQQSFGGQSDLYMNWAERLTRLRALIEAELDFADEEDVPGSVSDRVWPEIAALKHELDRHIAGARSGEIIRDGFKVVITGPPNAGKSSLLNRLADRDVAIVTEIAGTTRDLLHVDLDMDGYLVRFYDTAGLRETSDRVEQEGIKRAEAAIAQADMILDLRDIGAPDEDWPALVTVRTKDVPYLKVGTKRDLHGDQGDFDIRLSAIDGSGLSELRDRILASVRENWSGSAVPGRVRQVELLNQASNFLQEALHAGELDIRAEGLRSAANALGRMTGRVDVEQLLDVIFSQFCIGK